MKARKQLTIWITGFALAALAACNLPTPPPQEISPQDAINTSAARTVAALSTDLAAGKNPTLAAASAQPGTPVANTPIPTPLPAATEDANAPTADPNLPCNRASFVKDITIPDGAVLPANTAFVKTWELKNSGSCTWTSAYTMVFSGSGSALNGPASAPVITNGEVKPGESVKVSVAMRAPGEKGKYESRWLLRAPDGVTFGLGEKASGAFYVQIEVDQYYSFAEMACSAAWSTAAGALPCPGKENDANGAVLTLENPRLENGSDSEGLGLFTAAQPTNDGYIVGRYPAIMVPQEADFRAEVGCREGASGCFIRFKVTVQVDNGPEQTLGEWNEGLDGNSTKAIADLDAYAGKPTAFNLYVYVNGAPNAAKGLWFDPRVTR